MEREGLFNFAILRSVIGCQDQELVGHSPIELSFLLCEFLSCEDFSLEFFLTGVRIL